MPPLLIKVIKYICEDIERFASELHRIPPEIIEEIQVYIATNRIKIPGHVSILKEKSWDVVFINKSKVGEYEKNQILKLVFQWLTGLKIAQKPPQRTLKMKNKKENLDHSEIALLVLNHVF